MFKNLHANYQNRTKENKDPYYAEPVELYYNDTHELFHLPPELTEKPAIQPWSGLIPDCTLENKELCANLPVQTSNIKVNEIYYGIEHESDQWMKLACETAYDSVNNEGGPFGAVILQIDFQSNEIIRYWRNHNQVTDINDPTAHAEVMTIRSACKSLGVFNLGEISKDHSLLDQPGEKSYCVIYSSAEPCPMCYSAICWANIHTLLFAATRYDAAAQGVDFSDEEIYAELAVPYSDRKMKVCQCATPNSLDAFNTWKRSEKIPY